MLHVEAKPLHKGPHIIWNVGHRWSTVRLVGSGGSTWRTSIPHKDIERLSAEREPSSRPTPPTGLLHMKSNEAEYRVLNLEVTKFRNDD